MDRSPTEPANLLIKRIIATENQNVALIGYGANDGAVVKIPPGHCWVEGDSSLHSRDSKVFGPVCAWHNPILGRNAILFH